VRDRDGTVALFNLATREPEQQFQVEPTRSRFSFPAPSSISEDLGTLAQGVDDGTVKIWNTENHEFSSLKVSERAVDLLALSPDGRTLITGAGGFPGGHGHTLRWWDLTSGTNKVLSMEASKLVFAPDGRTLAAFGRGNSVRLWDVGTRSLRTNVVFDPQPASTTTFPAEFRNLPAAFSLDGRVLATATLDDTIRLLDAFTGKLLGTCTGHKQGVSSVAFSPDGKTLATASDDSTLKLWNVATQQELLTIRRLGGTLRGLSFSPDGRLLVGASGFSAHSRALRFYHARSLAEIDGASVVLGPRTAKP
jgi:WD40 repeat protein